VSALLDVDGLSVSLAGSGRRVTVVDRVGYAVEEGQVFGIAGESGSGKTVSALALMGLLPADARTSGSVRFGGRDLLRLRPRELRRLCGSQIGMVFQDPLTAFHPMLSIGRQLTEHVRRHLGVTRRAARERAIALLGDVRIPDPKRALDSYPHEFSGGMRQRIAIASALACEPRLLIADEPTTALDVTVQAGIIRLLDRLRREHRLSVILITHDLGVMSAIADELSIFYAGRVVEHGRAAEVLQAPRHPYTRALLDALPHPELPIGTPLRSIAGAPPRPGSLPRGCAFHPRCAYAQRVCSETQPPLVPVGERELACHVDPFAPR
jgi:oligopeptide/dipeptide ABC transporter ATP-binding protein